MADILNRTNLGMEVMYEHNAHNFALDLAGSKTGFSVAAGPVVPALFKTAIVVFKWFG